MSLTIIYYLLFLHWVADFILQKDYWAKNKSHDNWILTKHILVYSFVIFIGAVTAFLPLGIAIHFAILNGVAHWLTDYWTSRATAYLYKKADYHNFFVVIGIDQVLHYIVLFWTASIFLKG